MRKYKVGDKVKVREDLKCGEYYRGLFFDRDMQSYCGNEYMIKAESSISYNYKLDDSYWEFNDEMLFPVEEEKKQIHNQNINADTYLKLEEIITPQSFESNDGRFRVEVEDDGYLELTMTNLRCDQEGYHQKDIDDVQVLLFSADDLQRLIDILTRAKEINPYSLDTLKEKSDKNVSC